MDKSTEEDYLKDLQNGLDHMTENVKKLSEIRSQSNLKIL